MGSSPQIQKKLRLKKYDAVDEREAVQRMVYCIFKPDETEGV
jgi:hypothetical protein